MDANALIVVGLLSGVVCAMLAVTKNRSPGVWFAFGFFFSLIAVIAVLVFPSEPSATTPVPPQPAPSSPDALEQLAKLGSLRASGVLTEAEFEQKKQQILERV